MAEPVTVDDSSQPLAIATSQQSYKCLLNQQVQKLGKQLPLYQTHNEGSEHQPKFRTTVWVDGVSYTSPNTFQLRKTAEMDGSKFTLSAILHKLKTDTSNLIREDKTYCKSILIEYAAKMRKEKPIYQIIQVGAPIPVFRSTLVFDNATFAGDDCRSKKEAEQSAARAVILKYIDSEAGIVMSEIVYSKFKLYGTKEIESANNGTNGVNGLSMNEARGEEVTKMPLMESCLVQGATIPKRSAPVQTPFAPVPSSPPSLVKDANTPAMDLHLVFSQTKIPGISAQAPAPATPVFTALGQTPIQASIQTTTVPTQSTIQAPIQTTPVPTQAPIQAPIQTTTGSYQTPILAPIQTTPIPTQTPIQTPLQTAPVSTQAPIQAPIQTTMVPRQTPVQAPIQTTLVPAQTPTQVLTQTTPMPAVLEQATPVNPASSKRRNRKNRKNAQKRMCLENQLAMSAVSPGQVPTFSAQ